MPTEGFNHGMSHVGGGFIEDPKPEGLRIIVCGGRDFNDKAKVDEALNHLHAKRKIGTLVHGGAPGADTLAGQWAASRGIYWVAFKADWKALGPKAGPIRNQAMADAGADGCVALPGGRGTADMVRRAEAKGIPVWKPFG